MRDNCRELWWHMAGGKQSEYEKIKALNVFEFYTLHDLWAKELQTKISASRQKK